ncbi:MAG: hypothetical protein EOO42_08765 [Flavobacteriales bacterium]|nr:MAG: hypothetical protein EOO42_08765 [Flavobacteriales bacterium]
MSKAQVANAPCNSYSPLVSTTYSMSAESSQFLFNDQWEHKNNLIDGTVDNPATWGAVLLGSAFIDAKNVSTTDFPAGSYAGFVVSDLDLVSLGASMTVTTYNGNTLQESKTFDQLVGTILDGGKRKIGFVTAKSFDRIRLTVNAGLTLVFTAQAYYAEVVKPCAGAPLACNTTTPLAQPNFGAVVEQCRTGLDGLALGFIDQPNNVTTASTTDYATLSLNASVLGTAKLSVRDLVDTFAAGTFAGFDVENVNLASLSAFSSITVNTYLKGVLQESKTGTSLWVSLPLLDIQNRTVLGFETTKSFDEVQIVLNQPLGVALGVTKVFSAVVKKACEGVALTCNTPIYMTEPNYPVNINTVRTGVSGFASAISKVNEPDNVLDSNNDNYATIAVPLTAGTTASLSVLKSLSDLPAGTYAGFDIQNISLINAQFLQNITLKTYNNGLLQESVSGNGILFGAGTDLLASDGRAVVGFVTTKAFDEVQISLNNVLGFDIGNTRVYKMVTTKPCAKTINCNSSYYLAQPDFPVVLNAQRTGLKTLGCGSCSVNNPDNIIDNNPNNFSRITLAAGVLNSGSISVLDPSATYPKGAYAGFTVKDRYFFVQGDLLEFITVRTYNNGVLQESKTSTDLLDLTLLFPIWGTGTRNVGFRTTKDFDEVQIETFSIASLANVLDVYGAIIDTRSCTQLTGPSCMATLVAKPDVQTVLAGNTGAASVLANDTYTGTPANTSNVTINQISTTNAGVNVNPSTGLVTVNAGTPAGTYTVVYQICDNFTPNNCKQTTATITVPLPAIVATNDTQTINAGSTGTVSVLSNDTYNGTTAATNNVNLTQVSTTNSGITLNTATGNINVAAGAPAGTYTVDYKICDKVNVTNCKSATATATVPQTTAPDLSLQISASASVIKLSDDNTIIYTIKNVGTAPISGTTTLTITKSVDDGDLSVLNLPQGWTLVSQSGNTLVFSTNSVIADGSSQTISLNYYSDTKSQNFIGFVGNISSASGGETSTTNNSDSIVMSIQVL